MIAMSLNLVNTTAARQALFLAGSWAILAGETEKPREPVLYALNYTDREILAFEALGMIAETQDGLVSQEDIVCAAWSFAISPQEIPAIATDLYHALRD